MIKIYKRKKEGRNDVWIKMYEWKKEGREEGEKNENLKMNE